MRSGQGSGAATTQTCQEGTRSPPVRAESCPETSVVRSPQRGCVVSSPCRIRKDGWQAGKEIDTRSLARPLRHSLPDLTGNSLCRYRMSFSRVYCCPGSLALASVLEHASRAAPCKPVDYLALKRPPTWRSCGCNNSHAQWILAWYVVGVLAVTANTIKYKHFIRGVAATSQGR